VGVILEHGGHSYPGVTVNISRSGLLFRSQQQISVQGDVSVTIVHESTKLRASGRATYIGAEGIGVEFVELSDDFSSGLETLLRELVGGGDLPDADLRLVKMTWTYQSDGLSIKNIWHLRERTVEISSLSLEGASFKTQTKPSVAEEIVVYLKVGEEQLYGRASVVRYTDAGFAVQFISPRLEFRRLVSRARRISRATDSS
jgi:hypothetical protein